jgi:hypothetical protein
MNQDFRDLLAEFNAHGVEYIVVGAHALAAHGHVRATKDLDVWVRPERGNATRVEELFPFVATGLIPTPPEIIPASLMGHS